MKVVFAHDNRFIPVAGTVYSESQFPAKVWSRYLDAFDEVVVACREGVKPNGGTLDQLVVCSRPNVYFRYLPDLSNTKSLLIARGAAKESMRAILSDADAVIARLPSEIGLLAISEARRLNKPWAVEVVGCGFDALWNYGNWRGKVYAPVMFWRMRLAVNCAKFALYVTHCFLQNRYPSPGSLAVSCSNVDMAPPQADVLECRKKRIESPGKVVRFGIIGSLKTKYKGIQTILAALGRIRARLPSFEFHILGDGDPEPWRNLAARHGVDDLTFFDGVLQAGEPVLTWLDAVDIYLQPSLQEGLPRGLIEAMSRGCPSLGSYCAGIPELLDADCLIRPGDVAQLSVLIMEMVSNVAWQQNQSLRNWQKAQEYDREILNERRSDFWKRFSQSCRTQVRH